MIEWFIGKFTKAPELYWNEYPWWYIVRCEIIHFLFGLAWGLVGYYLMQTILHRSIYKWDDRFIFLSSLLFGVCLSVTSHIILDLTGIA